MAKNQFNENVIHSIHQWFIHNEGEYKSREEILSMSKSLALEIFLEWEGIIGYTDDILSIMKKCE